MFAGLDYACHHHVDKNGSFEGEQGLGAASNVSLHGEQIAIVSCAIVGVNSLDYVDTWPNGYLEMKIFVAQEL